MKSSLNFLSPLQEKVNSGFLQQAFPVDKLALDNQGSEMSIFLVSNHNT